MQLLADAGFLPVTQAAPTTHAATAAHLARKQVPTQTRLQDEKDAREHCTIVERLAHWVTVAPLQWRRSFGGGSNGSTSAHRLSSSIGFAMALASSKQRKG